MRPGLLGFGAGEHGDPLIINYYSETNADTDQQIRAAATVARGQCITLASAESIAFARFWLKKVGSPTGNITATLFGVTGTVGTDAKGTGSVLATSDAVDIATLTTDYQLVEFTFSTPYAAGSGDICLCAEYSGGNTSNYLHFPVDSSSPSHGGNATRRNSGGTWTDYGSQDAIFYLGRS